MVDIVQEVDSINDEKDKVAKKRTLELFRNYQKESFKKFHQRVIERFEELEKVFLANNPDVVSEIDANSALRKNREALVKKYESFITTKF